jgi:hypothetical protein
MTTKHWVLFQVAASELLAFLRLIGRDSLRLHAPALPPDVAVFDTVYDPEADTFTLVLESELFAPVQAALDGTTWSGAFPEVVFALDGVRHTAPPARVRPSPLPDEVRWEAYLMSPSALLRLLNAVADGADVAVDPLPPDARLADAYYDIERQAIALLVESALFEPAPMVRDSGGETRLQLPDRWLDV